MRAVLLTGHGGFDRLDLRDDVDVPRCGADDVLVRVGAAAVNNTDINTRVGWYSGGGWTGAFEFPRIQGIDACGTIVSVGADVDSSRVGQRVLVEPCWRDPVRFLGSEVDGAFAEYCRVPTRYAHVIDCSFTDIELASFPCSYSTAENMLTRAAVGAGQRVLVTGASGGVGSAAVQLAAARGAVVAALAATDKQEAVQALGADVVATRDADLVGVFGADSFDVVIDVVGGDGFPRLLDVLRPFGAYAAAGAIGGPVVELDLRTMYLKDLRLFGCTVLGEGVFAALVRRIEHGDIAPAVAATFPLEHIVEAQELFLTKQHVGKIVLQVSSAH
jgi:NADPH:quinone reductase-like Zn-dependent oxidoreductase